MLWENLREEEFDAAIEESFGLCVLPLGCLEKHGQHLPVGTDYFEAMGIARAAADIESAVIFPSGAWLGEVSCFHAFKNPKKARLRGCIGIKQETLLRLLSELCDEIARNGFNKILIVNGHGGNDAMIKHFLRSQSYESKAYATLMTSAFAFSDIDPRKLYGIINSRKKDFSYLTDEDMETLLRFKESGCGGGHADIRETSLVMDYDRSLVREDRYDAESGESTNRSDELLRAGVDYSGRWLLDFPNSYEANAPHGASDRIGRAMKQICAERLAKIFRLVKDSSAPLDAARI